jgi:hypothetical protein
MITDFSDHYIDVTSMVNLPKELIVPSINTGPIILYPLAIHQTLNLSDAREIRELRKDFPTAAPVFWRFTFHFVKTIPLVKSAVNEHSSFNRRSDHLPAVADNT